MQPAREVGPLDPAVELWLDPVCPFSWNTARWLTEVAEAGGFHIEWHLMSLAVLNEGQTLPPPAQARMDDSRRIGRLMAAIEAELGQIALAAAYFAFGTAYFDHEVTVDEHLATQVVKAAGSRAAPASSLLDESLDATVRKSHEGSQRALGMAGGSPIVTIGGHTLFGPVLTSVPEEGARQALFDAVTVLASTSEFSQLERPRASQGSH